MTAARKLLIAPAAAAGGAFDPVTDITWHSAFWAEGTDFVALGYSDTATVGTWPNETGESDATQATEGDKPVYAAADSTMNSQPCVTNDGAANSGLVTAAFGVNPSYAAKVSIVTIGYYNTKTGVQFAHAGRVWNLNNELHVYSSGTTSIKAGGATRWSGSEASNAAPHMWVAVFDGSTGEDELWIDNTKITLSGTDAGSDKISGLSMFGKYDLSGSNLDGGISFQAIYEGDLSADGAWTDFKTWVTDHYGITLA